MTEKSTSILYVEKVTLDFNIHLVMKLHEVLLGQKLFDFYLSSTTRTKNEN